MVNQSSESRQTQAFSNAYETVLPEHYRLVEMVGRGGMAEVFLGEDTRLGRKVAIKFLNAEFRRDPDRVRRFRQEARSASALNHPNILTIHDIGDNNGVQFIVSEFVEGETLGARIAQGRLSLAETIEIAMQIASALSASHSAGIVHRDIKPDNVMIRWDGVVKVLDFGLAKARGFTTLNGGDFDAMTLDSGSTSPGLIVGTPQYMSPEQARGKELDGRTDIFSLGILIFEMVTRNSPFDTGSFADTMAAILTKEPKRLEEFIDDPPVRLIELVSKCLKKDRDERFSSMAEIVRELKLLKGEEVPNSVITGEVSVIDTGQTQAVPTHRHSIRSFLSSGIRERTPVTAIILVTAALLVGGWWAWNRVSFTTSAPALMRTVPITSWSSSIGDFAAAAAFSYDERMIAFTARRAEGSEIWMKPTLGGDAIQVTKNGFYNQYPVWSPSGLEIAFFASHGTSRGIWRTTFTGGDQKQIVAGVDPTARPQLWGRSGRIYFQSKNELLAVEGVSSEITKLTEFESTGIKPITIEISPDEKKIAYSVKEDGRWKVYVRRLDSGSVETVATSSEKIDYLAWRPQGDSVYCSLSVNGTLQVFEARLGNSEPVQLTNGNLDFFVHDVSSTGRILYGSISEASDLWKLETGSGEEYPIANEVATEYWADAGPAGKIVFQSVSRVGSPSAGTVRIASSASPAGITTLLDGFSPKWSPKGTWIGFFRRKDAQTELWRVSPSGDGAVRIGSPGVISPDYMAMPYLKVSSDDFNWSPGEEYLAYSALTDNATNIWLAPMSLDSEDRNLTDNVSPSETFCCPVWTPDGRSVIFTSTFVSESLSRTVAFRIWRVSVDGAGRRMLLETKERFRLLGLSSGGNELIYAKSSIQSDSGPVPRSIDIVSLSMDTGDLVTLDRVEDAYYYNIHLSKDGRSIAYVTRKGDVSKIITLQLRVGARKELLTVTDPKVFVSSISWSPDGSFLVFGKQTRTNLLSMLTE